jgi:hypothetical protein
VENLGKVATWADTIKSNSQKILDRVAKDRETLEAKVEVLREKVAVIAAMTHEGVG